MFLFEFSFFAGCNIIHIYQDLLEYHNLQETNLIWCCLCGEQFRVRQEWNLSAECWVESTRWDLCALQTLSIEPTAQVGRKHWVFEWCKEVLFLWGLLCFLSIWEICFCSYPVAMEGYTVWVILQHWEFLFHNGLQRYCGRIFSSMLLVTRLELYGNSGG